MAAKSVQKLDPQSTRGLSVSKAHIVAIGGGKGGIGKSFISSSLSIFFANMGLRTILVDLDLGAANAHTVLGETQPKVGLSDYVNSETKELIDVAVPTRFANLRLIAGANDSLDMADLDEDHRSRLMSAIYNLDADCVVLDLSAGTHSTTLDFFLMAQDKIVTMTPDPSSIENGYRLMKAAFFRRLKRFEHQLELSKEIEDAMKRSAELGIKSPGDLLAHINKQDPKKGADLLERMQKLEFSILLNQARNQKDSEIGISVKSITQRYFGLPASFVGAVDYENTVWQALRKKKHLIMDSPMSSLYSQLLTISRDLVQKHKRRVK